MSSHDPELKKALRFSEARFLALFQDNPTMAVILDAEWTMLSANQSCTTQLGYAVDELQGQSVLKLFHEDDRAGVAHGLQRCLENPDQVYRWQFRKVRKDGGLLWVKEIVQAVHDLNGALNVLVVCQNVTELKQMKTEIQDARKYAENVVEALIEPLVVLNADLKILTANRSFYDTFQVTPEETIGNLIYDVGNRQWDIPKLRVLFEEILPVETVFNGYEVEHDFANIGRKTIVFNARQIFRNGIGSHVILLAMEDITERKRAESESNRDRILLEEAEKLARVGAWEWDIVENRFHMSQEWLRIHGSDDPSPSRETLMLIAHPEDRDAITRAFNDSIEKGAPYDIVHRIVRPSDGEVRIIQAYGHVMKGPSGNPTRMYGAAQDITERKEAEEEIRRLNSELTERAAELEAASREQVSFNHTVAHDLRQPLNILSSYCQVIDKQCGDQLQEECRGYIRDAYNVTVRMNSLITALLNFSNLGIVEPRREMVDLSALAQEASLTLKMTDPERQVDVRIADRIVANCDANLLRAVLNNLLGNAWKYTGMREQAIIEFGERDIDGIPAYFVRDNGAGFDMTDADKLFTPFQRLPNTEQFPGFGIGLATVERIIRRHGGKVWAEGEPDKGACIYFTLSAD